MMKIPDDITNEIMLEPMSIEADGDFAVGERLAGKGKILVMDDDEPVRVTVKLVLQRIEYEVETAKDGAETVDIYEKAREANRPFDAVIVDLTVADGMGGRGDN